MVGYRRFLSSTTLFVFFLSAFLIRASETRNVRVCEPPSISSSDCQDNSERNSTQIERRSLAGGGRAVGGRGRGRGRGRGSGGGRGITGWPNNTTSLFHHSFLHYLLLPFWLVYRLDFAIGL